MTLTPATGCTPEGLPLYIFEREAARMVVLDAQVNGEDVVLKTQATVYDEDDETRPAEDQWVDATPAGDVTGYLVSGLPTGLHTIWVKYPASPETEVRRVAVVRIV